MSDSSLLIRLGPADPLPTIDRLEEPCRPFEPDDRVRESSEPKARAVGLLRRLAAVTEGVLLLYGVAGRVSVAELRL